MLTCLVSCRFKLYFSSYFLFNFHAIFIYLLEILLINNVCEIELFQITRMAINTFSCTISGVEIFLQHRVRSWQFCMTSVLASWHRILVIISPKWWCFYAIPHVFIYGSFLRHSLTIIWKLTEGTKGCVATCLYLHAIWDNIV